MARATTPTPRFAVVTDSTSDIAPEIAAAEGIDDRWGVTAWPER